jgi:HTH-type transcriptional regulator / antitoxin HipB
MHDHAYSIDIPLQSLFNMTDMTDSADSHATLAAAFRQRRMDLGLTQEQLAELASCSTRFIHSIEAGKPSLRFDKLLSAMAVLGLSIQLQRGKAGKVHVEASLVP